jgi:hypothetical protein
MKARGLASQASGRTASIKRLQWRAEFSADTNSTRRMENLAVLFAFELSAEGGF